LKIGPRTIGRGCPPYVVAELSANHQGSLERALKSIEVFKRCGADAVKLQTYTPDTITIACDSEDFRIRGGLWDGYTLYELYKQAYTPYEWHKPLFDHARKVGITIFSTPFDETAVDLLEDLNAPAYKIASFEAVDLPLIQYVAGTGKPMIISTGMATWEEIGEAVETARSNGCKEIALLHCVSSYPAPIEQCNLRTIPALAERFGVVAGLSDHTLGTTVAIAGVALGACIIEKHVTLSRADSGPDSAFSLEPDELKILCNEVKDSWLALGEVKRGTVGAEAANIKFRRSLYFVKDLKAGDVITSQVVRSIRPGYGLPPKDLDRVLGRKVKRAVAAGTPVRWDLIA